jgi:streptomycin 3"-adenylyltransferase
MGMLKRITEEFVYESQRILGDNLIGIYLHGSAVMGCFNEKSSDIDLLVVVNTSIPDETKRRYMDMVVKLNAIAPSKGIEMSIVRQAVCRPFAYPTPFELHFSVAHLDWYRNSPEDYVVKMRGTDKDLAAHFKILWHRGKCLCGAQIHEVFEEVGKAEYFDSILSDVENAEEDIIENPTYIILNLCRVLAYREDGLVLSKQEGGNWGLEHIPEKYHPLIRCALEHYSSGKSAVWSRSDAQEFAGYMISKITQDN